MSIGQEKLIQHIVCDRAAAIKSCRAKSIVCPEHPFNVIDFSGMVMRSWRQVAKPEARPNLVYDGRSASEILDRVCRFRNWSFVVGLVSPIVRHPTNGLVAVTNKYGRSISSKAFSAMSALRWVCLAASLA